MSMRRFNLCVPQVLVVLALQILCMHHARAGATVELITAEAPGADRAMTAAMQVWCKQAAEATLGRVQCSASSAHIPSDKTAEALESGQVDLAVVSHGGDPARYRLSRIAELPFLGDFSETVSSAYQRIYERTPAMAREHRGLQVLAVFVQGPGYLFTTSRPPTNVSQLGGLSTSGPDASLPSARALHMLVADPSAVLPVGGKRPIDAYLATAHTIALAPDRDRLRTATMIPGGLFSTTFAFAMNQKKWMTLSPEDRRALTDISGVRTAAAFGRGLDGDEWKANMKLRGNGVAFHAPSADFLAQLRVALRATEVSWLNGAKQAGFINGRRLLNELREEAARQEVAE
jgi:TRAP-type transport system periplasmic protein